MDTHDPGDRTHPVLRPVDDLSEDGPEEDGPEEDRPEDHGPEDHGPEDQDYWDVDVVDWQPLRRVVPPSRRDEFIFMGSREGLRRYRHSATGRDLVLDRLARPHRDDGHGGYRRTTKAWALKHVFEGLDEQVAEQKATQEIKRRLEQAGVHQGDGPARHGLRLIRGGRA